MPHEETFIYSGMVNEIDNYNIAFAFYDEESHSIGFMIVEQTVKRGHRAIVLKEGDMLPFNSHKKLHKITPPAENDNNRVVPVASIVMI